MSDNGLEIIYNIRKDGDLVGEQCCLGPSRRDRAVAVEALGAMGEDPS
jgi:hypothetical protein